MIADLFVLAAVSVGGCTIAGLAGLRLDTWLQRRGWWTDPPAADPVALPVRAAQVWVPAPRTATRAPSQAAQRAG